MRFTIILIILFYSCTSEKIEVNTSNINSEIKISKTDSSNTIEKQNRLELFTLLNSKIKIEDFKVNQENEFINFATSSLDFTKYNLPEKIQIGCYPISYDLGPDEKYGRKHILNAQVHVYRPYTNSTWFFGDSTEKIFSFKILSPDITIYPIPRIGMIKSNIINEIGKPNINRDSIITYFEILDKYKLNIDFQFSNDTLIKIEYNKFKN